MRARLAHAPVENHLGVSKIDAISDNHPYVQICRTQLASNNRPRCRTTPKVARLSKLKSGTAGYITKQWTLHINSEAFPTQLGDSTINIDSVLAQERDGTHTYQVTRVEVEVVRRQVVSSYSKADIAQTGLERSEAPREMTCGFRYISHTA